MLWLALIAGCGGPPPSPSLPPYAVPPDDLPPTAKTAVWQDLVDDLRSPRHPSDGGGTLSWHEPPPERLVVGDRARFAFTLEVGPGGIAEGGSVSFVAPPFWGWSPPQVADARGPGFVALLEGPEGVTLRPDQPDPGFVRFRVEGRALAPGERLSWSYGGGDAGAQVDRFAERDVPFEVGVDGDGDGVRALVDEPLRVEIHPGPAARLHLVAPTTGRPGARVPLRVTALDAAGNPVEEVVEVALVAHGATVPSPVRLDPQHREPIHAVLGESGIAVFGASAGEGLAAAPAPTLVHPEAQRVAWADLQIHTALSDGTGRLDDVYRYARDVAGLDAVAVTDHDHWGMRFLDRTPAMWAEVQEAAEAFHDPGTFVTFPAYEWTSWLYGHRHVLYVGEPGPVHGSLDVDTRTPAGLWAALAPHDALTIAHHSAGGPVAVDWRHAPPADVEPVTELCSVHGSSEAEDAPGRIYGWVEGNGVREAALGRGYRLGFLCSTDGHDGHPGLAHLAAPQGGLAAIVTDDLTRAGIAEALRARRTYGTNGVRLHLRATAGGHLFGEVLHPPEGPLDIDVRLVAPQAVRAVELVGPDGVLTAASPAPSPMVHVTLTLDDPRAVPFAYVRVLLDGGGAAWASPWFFEAP